MEAKLPAVVSVLKGINEPRLPNLMGIRKAAKVQIPVWDSDEIGAAKDKIGAEGAAVKVVELTTPPRTIRRRDAQGRDGRGDEPPRRKAL